MVRTTKIVFFFKYLHHINFHVQRKYCFLQHSEHYFFSPFRCDARGRNGPLTSPWGNWHLFWSPLQQTHASEPLIFMLRPVFCALFPLLAELPKTTITVDRRVLDACIPAERPSENDHHRRPTRPWRVHPRRETTKTKKKESAFIPKKCVRGLLTFFSSFFGGGGALRIVLISHPNQNRGEDTSTKKNYMSPPILPL